MSTDESIQLPIDYILSLKKFTDLLFRLSKTVFRDTLNTRNEVTGPSVKFSGGSGNEE